jgi:hypothetical protein
MSDDSNALRVDISGDDEIRPSEGEGRFEVPSYDIDPSDQHIADVIMKQDPVSSVPGPFSGLEGKLTVEPKLTSLPIPLREKVERQLAMVPPSRYAESEREFVTAALKEHSLSVRTQAGVAGTALPIHKVQAELAIKYRDLARRFNDNQAKLADVRDYGTAYDDKGQRIPVPVYTFDGTAREGILREQEDLAYHMNLLEGPEGQRLLQKALKESVEVYKARQAAAAEEAEVQSRAEAKVRESRIERRAAARARMLDPDA